MATKLPAILLPLFLLAAPVAVALDPGDCMVVGYNSAGTDAVSFVTWVEQANGASITLTDADYDGGGDGSGEGTGGGSYGGGIETIVWTNTTGSPVAPGTVIVIETSAPSASIGSASGDGFGLTNQGEHVFLLQGSFNGSGNLIGDLLFGLDYDGNGSWGEFGESDLPGALNVPNGNLSFAHVDSKEYNGVRSGLSFGDYPAEISNTANWATPGGSLSSTNFEGGSLPPPPYVTPPTLGDRLGAVHTGLIFHPKRLNNASPIIDESWMVAQGTTSGEADNINGPSCVRIPDWVTPADRAHPSAVYYLYFGSHSGEFIRMAWAANLEGPWTGFHLSSALPLADRGVLSLGSDGEITPGNHIVVDGHIASPQVLIDEANQQFVMYYHGPVTQNGSDKGQSTVVATSSDGLNFNLPSDGGQAGHGTEPVFLGESYFRVFQQAGDWYAFSNTGDLWKSPTPATPYTPPAGYDYSARYWDKGPNVFTDEFGSRGWVDAANNLRPRHFAVLKRDHILYSFLTHKTDAPERVMVATFDFDALPADYDDWTLRFPEQEVLRAENNWEGAQFPEIPSDPGKQNSGVNQLRDPEVFEDSDGRVYLFYTGQGEDAMGLARLVSAPETTGEAAVVRGEARTYAIETDIDVTTSRRRISHCSAVDVAFDAESATLPFSYSGNGGYSVIQSQTVANGTQSFQLAHLSAGDTETLAFPDRYYARPGALLRFRSRLGSSSGAQMASVQVSFDGSLWQSVWINYGDFNEGSFEIVDVDMDGLAGRDFHLRFVYRHDTNLSGTFTAGPGAGQGWFIDDVTTYAFEAVMELEDQAFTGTSFTLGEIDALIAPFLADGTGVGDRFLLAASGAHAGESTGFGKPLVIQMLTSYEQFQSEYFTEAERADAMISGEDADPDMDRLSNVLEHAFGSDPRTPNASPITVTDGPVAGVDPQLRFPWNPEANYTYQLQMSTDLQGFADIPFTESTSMNGDLLDVTVEPDASVTLDKAAFFRLKVVPE